MSKKLIEFAMCGSEGEKCDPYELTSPLERQKLLGELVQRLRSKYV